MSKFWRVAGVTAIVAALALAAVAAVSADGPRGGRLGWAGDAWGRMHEAIANALGITVEQYDEAVGTARDNVLQQAIEEGLLTQEQADQMQERLGEGFGPMAFGHKGFRGRGFMGPHMGRGGSLVSVAAEQLDMTVQELVDELEAGKTIADVAAEKGVEPQAIADAWLAERSEFLAQAVEAGRITQEQADEMLAHMQEEALEHLQETWPWEHDPEECEGMMLEGFGGFGPRGMHGFGGRGGFGCGM